MRDADPLGPVPPHSRQAPPEVSMSEPLSRHGCGDSRDVTDVCKGRTALSSHTPSALSPTPRLFQLGHAPHSGDCPGAPCSPPRRPLSCCPEPGSPSGVRRQRTRGGRTPGSSGRGCVRSPRETQARTKGGFLHPAFHSETVSGDALCTETEAAGPEQSPQLTPRKQSGSLRYEQVWSPEARHRRAPRAQGRFRNAQFQNVVIHLILQLIPPSLCPGHSPSHHGLRQQRGSLGKQRGGWGRNNALGPPSSGAHRPPAPVPALIGWRGCGLIGHWMGGLGSRKREDAAEHGGQGPTLVG